MDESECQNGGWCARQLSTGLTFCHCPPEYFGTLCENSGNVPTLNIGIHTRL